MTFAVLRVSVPHGSGVCSGVGRHLPVSPVHQVSVSDGAEETARETKAHWPPRCTDGEHHVIKDNTLKIHRKLHVLLTVVTPLERTVMVNAQQL